MRSIGRLFIIILLAALGAGLYLFGTGTTARTDGESPSEIRRAVDPQVVVVETEEDLEVEDAADNATAEAPTANAPTADAGPVEPEAQAAEAKAGESAQPEKPADKEKDRPAASESAQPETGTITAFSASATDEGFVLRLDGVPSDFTPEWFRLSSPARFVVDLPGNWKLKGSNVFRSQSGPIKHVVAGVHPDKLRFVVHFSEEASVPQGRPVFVHDEGILSVRVP